MLFESQDFLDPRGAGRDPLPLSSKVPLDLLVTVAVFASRLVLQAGSEVSQRPALLLLKPEQDYFHFHFPNSCSGSKDTKQSVIPKALSLAGHWIGSCQALAAVGGLCPSVFSLRSWGSCLGPLQLVLLIAVLLLAFDSLVGRAETRTRELFCCVFPGPCWLCLFRDFWHIVKSTCSGYTPIWFWLMQLYGQKVGLFKTTTATNKTDLLFTYHKISCYRHKPNGLWYINRVVQPSPQSNFRTFPSSPFAVTLHHPNPPPPAPGKK